MKAIIKKVSLLFGLIILLSFVSCDKEDEKKSKSDQDNTISMGITIDTTWAGTDTIYF